MLSTERRWGAIVKPLNEALLRLMAGLQALGSEGARERGQTLCHLPLGARLCLPYHTLTMTDRPRPGTPCAQPRLGRPRAGGTIKQFSLPQIRRGP